MVIARGEVWWADLGEPTGSEPGYRRAVVVVQCDAFSRSRIGTVVCVPLTSNLRWAGAPGNVLLEADATNLRKDSVANVSQVVALDCSVLMGWVGRRIGRSGWSSAGSTSCWVGDDGAHLDGSMRPMHDRSVSRATAVTDGRYVAP